MNQPIKKLCLVHLVRASNGIKPFRHFLESYRKNDGGIEHDLLILFKGFGQKQDTSKYHEILAPFRHATLNISDNGFDITAYLIAVKRFSEQYQYFCFLNSHSVILDRDWLKKLYDNLCKPAVGLVGATGSWQSHRGKVPSWKLPLTTAIRTYRLLQEKDFFQRIRIILNGTWMQSRFLMDFDLFPNFHLRTNAFMISSEIMMSLDFSSIISKGDAYLFESGKNGLTRQIFKKGKKVLIVGKDGRGYEKAMWRESLTFRQSEQENLLIADNQTRDYQEGNGQSRRYLSSITWGDTNWGGGNG